MIFTYLSPILFKYSMKGMTHILSVNSYNIPTRQAFNHFHCSEVQKVVWQAETHTTWLRFDVSFARRQGPVLPQYFLLSLQPEVSPLLSNMWIWPYHFFFFLWSSKPGSDITKIHIYFQYSILFSISHSIFNFYLFSISNRF